MYYCQTFVHFIANCVFKLQLVVKLANVNVIEIKILVLLSFALFIKITVNKYDKIIFWQNEIISLFKFSLKKSKSCSTWFSLKISSNGGDFPSITGPAPQGGVLGRRPPSYQTRPHLGKRKLWNICNSPPLINVSPPHDFISGAGPDERGDMLANFCQDDMIVTNTIFHQPLCRRWTWLSPCGNTWNQINYILVDKEWVTTIQNCKAWPGADCNSDHNLVAEKVKLK